VICYVCFSHVVSRKGHKEKNTKDAQLSFCVFKTYVLQIRNLVVSDYDSDIISTRRLVDWP